jgi:hypothetical protein
MTHSIFGWDLPPGCSMRDIERAAGGDDDALEAFSAYCEKNPKFLSDKESAILGIIFNNDFVAHLPTEDIQQLLYKISSWAYQQGYDQGKTDEGQYQDYEKEKGETS